MRDSRALVRRWRAGHAEAARLQRDLLRKAGPQPREAVAMLLDSLETLDQMGVWPGPRDPASEHQVRSVRRMWARLQRHARRAQKT